MAKLTIDLSKFGLTFALPSRFVTSQWQKDPNRISVCKCIFKIKELHILN